jgi:ketosteroid isomerase-like protein
MPSRNVEIVKRIYDAQARGDTAELLDLTDPEIRLYPRPSHPEAGVYRGHTGMLRILGEDEAIFDSIRYEPHEFVEVGNHVIVLLRQTGRGRTSGIEVNEHIVTVWRLAGGRAVESRTYTTEREALDALGLTQRPDR